MGNDNKKNKGGDTVIDALAETLGELLTLLFTALLTFIWWLLKKGFEAYQERVLHRPVVKPLTKKMLDSQKSTGHPNALGYIPSKKRDLLLPELKMERHTGIIGSTGSGKTVLLSNLQEHALSSGRAIIFFDPKTCHENIDNFKAICLKHKRKAYIIADYYGNSHSFNPLLEGTPNDVTEIIMNALDWSEPFYKNESQMALHQAIIQITRVQEEKLTFSRLIEALKKSPEKKNISGLISQLSFLEQSDYKSIINSTSDSGLTFSKIREEGACVYLGISALGLGSSGNILNKIYFGGLLLHCRMTYTRATIDKLKPFSLFFDELSSTVHEGFITLQNKCRGAKMEITYAIQCPSDIDRINKELTTQILENTNNLFVFNQVIPAHTELFAKMCGTSEGIKETYATENGRRGERGTEREIEEFLVHANIFRNLRVGQCVYFQRDPKRLEILNVRFKVNKNKLRFQNSPIRAESIF